MTFRNPHVFTVAYVAATIVIGLSIVLLPLNQKECGIVLSLQDFAQKTTGILVFRVLTYLGDFYLWSIFSAAYFFFAWYKSRKYLDSAINLAVFLMVVTLTTYLLKFGFARLRPSCPGVTIYDQEESFSYPSGHVSRAVGAFLVLSEKSNLEKSLAITAIFLVSLSRIVLGAHYLTDVVGGVFLSLANQRLADLIVSSFNHK